MFLFKISLIRYLKLVSLQRENTLFTMISSTVTLLIVLLLTESLTIHSVYSLEVQILKKNNAGKLFSL